MIVDAHVHVGVWDHADFLGRGCSLEEALRDLTEAGVGGLALMPTDRCRNAELLADAKRALTAGCSSRLWFFAWIRPGTADLEWARQNVGDLTGVKLHPSLSRLRVTDAAYREVLELADEHDLVVLVHCGRWQEIASFELVLQVAREFPNVRFQLAHSGGDTPPLATAACEAVLERGLDNVWFDISGLREYWVIERNVRRLGARRYLMGSDYNLAHPRMYVGAVEGMALEPLERTRILGGNAVELYGPSLAAG